jgi:flagellar biosynthetic protein FlhB
MAENGDGQEKKHEPSERRWEDAADRGELPRSADLSGAVVLGAGIAALMIAAPLIRDALAGVFAATLAADGPPRLDRGGALVLFAQAARGVGLAVAAPLGAVSLAAIAVGWIQTRGHLATKGLEVHWERLDPISGFQNAYASMTPIVELVKGLLKIGVLAWLAWIALAEPARVLPTLAAVHPSDQIGVWLDLAKSAGLYVLLGAALIGLSDFGWTWWRKSQDLMMTDQEAKDDHKEREGDPQKRSRQRQRARQIALGGMIAAVRKADVVVTNPTHYAVALVYERGKHAAPIVVAKGTDEIALKLRAAAREAGVPRIEDRPLARGLFARVKVGHPVPEDLYGPVARVLAVVYARRRKKRR